jgi:hypothetical protein
VRLVIQGDRVVAEERLLTDFKTTHPRRAPGCRRRRLPVEPWRCAPATNAEALTLKC